MRLHALPVALLLASACAAAPAKPAAKGAPAHCPESQRVCLQDTRCEYDTRRECQVCACRAWNDTGPRGTGPAGRAVPEETPGTRLPPPEPGR